LQANNYQQWGELMAIPPFTNDGVLPPFIGSSVPVSDSSLMTPHKATVAEVVQAFSTTSERRHILIGWLQYRQALRAIGLRRGFQWLGGSFLEEKERLRGSAPDDIDVMVFFRRPPHAKSDKTFRTLAMANRMLFDAPFIKAQYKVHAFRLDMDSNTRSLIPVISYFLLLFTHQRDTYAWKGMLEVDQEDDADETALLAHLQAVQSAGDTP
jgi:hypothetical protein